MKHTYIRGGILTIAAIVAPLALFAQTAPAETPAFNSGDIAWMCISTALVAMMTPAGLALFYGGMTPTRNVINTVGMSYMAYVIATVLWIMVCYSLSFGPSQFGGLIGNFDLAFMMGVSIRDHAAGAPTIPTLLFMAFQGTFAAITVALISGSLIERMKFSAWLVFVFLWSLIVYAPVAHWVWGGGFLSGWGCLDFAGGMVVHITAGVSGLVMALLLGPRKAMDDTELGAYSIKFTVLGAALLWFGWFGFNGGSALAANEVAASAFVVTNVSAVTGVIGWMLIEWLFTGKYTMFGAASGTVAGLVAITPAAGFVSVPAAMAIGLLGGLIGYFGVYELKKSTGIDDSLDTFGVHGLVGMWGALATGIFADPDIQATASGLWYGNAAQVGIQAAGAGVTALYSAVGTFVCYWITHFITRGVRVSLETEKMGIDRSFHGESA